MTLSQFTPLYFELEEAQNVTIARFVVPRLTDEENIEQLGHELFALVEQFDRRKIVLNMMAVQYVTSSVLGKLITLHRKLHRNDGALVLCSMLPPVLDVMRTSRLLDYFTVAADCPEAIAVLIRD